jgi:hypothetical protein
MRELSDKVPMEKNSKASAILLKLSNPSKAWEDVFLVNR